MQHVRSTTRNTRRPKYSNKFEYQQSEHVEWTRGTKATTHLADKIEQVEDSNEEDGHPAAEATADDLWLNAGKQRQSYEVDDADGRHVRPDAFRYLKPRH